MTTKRHPSQLFIHIIALQFSLVMVDERFANHPVSVAMIYYLYCGSIVLTLICNICMGDALTHMLFILGSELLLRCYFGPT